MTPHIFLHAALGNSRQMDPIARLFLPDRPFLCFDFEGHTGSIPEKPFRIPEMARQVRQTILDSGYKRPVIFGYSMGGYVGAYLAIHFPELVGGLITWGTKWDWNPAFAQAEVKKLDKQFLLAEAPAFVDNLRQKFGEPNWANVLSATEEMMLHLGNYPPISPEDWTLIRCPVLVLRGEKDRMVTAEESGKFAGMLPAGRYVEIPGQPHFLEKADISRIRDVVTGF